MMPTPEHVIISSYGGKFYEDKGGAESLLTLDGCTFSRLEWPAYAWPGGYTIYYVTKDGGCLCAKCANENLNMTLDKDYDQWFIVGQEINYEDPDLQCDNCYGEIPASYGED